MMLKLQPVRPARTPSFWLQSALQNETADRNVAPVAEGELKCDICIVGGGYTGLWTALRLLDLEPSLSVIVLEADLCGSGASGRNGGLAIGWWSKLETLISLCGTEEAIRLAKASADAVDEIGNFALHHGIDVHFRKRGLLRVETTPLHKGSSASNVALTRELGLDVYEELDVSSLRERADSSTFVSGVLDKTAATIQPALLARGLQHVAMAMGVQVFERSPVIEVNGGNNPIVRTLRASIRADKVVLTTNAWLAGIPELRRAMIVVSSDMIATPPIGAELADLGWTGGEGIADARLMVHYLQATVDGRIALGRGSGALAHLGRVSNTFNDPGRRTGQITEGLRFLFPSLSTVEPEYAWTGPIDRTRSGTMIFGTLTGQPTVHYAAGYSGTGVAPSLVAARVIASTVLDRQDEWQRSPINRSWLIKYPPDPVRFFGGLFVRGQVFRKEENEQRGIAAGFVRQWTAAQANPRLPSSKN
ncbi:FAD-dependent oxidoreductase [soil metagenome]